MATTVNKESNSYRINAILDRKTKEKLDVLKNKLEKEMNINLSYKQVLVKMINEYFDVVAREEKDK